jgi:hypothetical protein
MASNIKVKHKLVAGINEKLYGPSAADLRTKVHNRLIYLAWEDIREVTVDLKNIIETARSAQRRS